MRGIHTQKPKDGFLEEVSARLNWEGETTFREMRPVRFLCTLCSLQGSLRSKESRVLSGKMQHLFGGMSGLAMFGMQRVKT